jgi:hypothetical protein
MDRIERLKDLIPKLKANKKIQPLKIGALEWELRFLESERKQLAIPIVGSQRELLQKIEKVKTFEWGIDPTDNERRMCELINLL